MNTNTRPSSPRSRRAMAMPPAWLSAWPNEPVVNSKPGECSAPIISTVLPSVLNCAKPSGAIRPVSTNTA